MATVTLTTLRSRVRERADMPVAGFIADSATSIDAFINEGVQRLHARVIEALGRRYIESSSALTTIAGTSDYALPSDFYQLYGIDLTISGKTRSVRHFTNAERNYFKNANNNANWMSTQRYELAGSNLRLLPVPQSVMTGTIYYAPSPALLVSGSDSVNYPNGWERCIVLYAAIQCLIKEESDQRPLQRVLDEAEASIDKQKEDRDSAFPQQATDMDAVNYLEFW